MQEVTRNTDDMREGAGWMSRISDDEILELCRDCGNLTPRAIEDLGGPSRKHAGVRARELTRYGFLERISVGLYRITDTGTAWLDEELDASTVEPDDDRLETVADQLRG